MNFTNAYHKIVVYLRNRSRSLTPEKEMLLSLAARINMSGRKILFLSVAKASFLNWDTFLSNAFTGQGQVAMVTGGAGRG